MFARFFSRKINLTITGKKVVLRFPRHADYAAWSKLRHESRAFLVPWEPRWHRDELEPSGWQARQARYVMEYRNKTAVAFFVYERETDRLAGGISIGNIRRGVAQSGQIGYWMGEKFAGRGFMSEALNLVVEYAFNSLQLHRIEAACIPDNSRSMRLLEGAGFQREGLLRSYLKINDEWRDHYLYALMEPGRQQAGLRD